MLQAQRGALRRSQVLMPKAFRHGPIAVYPAIECSQPLGVLHVEYCIFLQQCYQGQGCTGMLVNEPRKELTNPRKDRSACRFLGTGQLATYEWHINVCHGAHEGLCRVSQAH
jgi:hypothetical protein